MGAVATAALATARDAYEAARLAQFEWQGRQLAHKACEAEGLRGQDAKERHMDNQPPRRLDQQAFDRVARLEQEVEPTNNASATATPTGQPRAPSPRGASLRHTTTVPAQWSPTRWRASTTSLAVA